MLKKLKGLLVNSDSRQEPTSNLMPPPAPSCHQMTSFQIKKTVDTWMEVSLLNQWSYWHCIPIGLNSYSIVNLVSISFIRLFSLLPYNKIKHQHVIPVLEGVEETCPKTHDFFHLKLRITNHYNLSFDFMWPFLAVDWSPSNSQVLLGQPALKDF